MSVSSRELDRLQATFDHDGIVANAGLVVPATLMIRLGLEASTPSRATTSGTRLSSLGTRVPLEVRYLCYTSVRVEP